MDKYVIDLDKVLDELELNDDEHNNEFSTNNTTIPNNDGECGKYQFSCNDKINMADADFSIHIKPSSKLLTNTTMTKIDSNNVSCAMEPNNNSIIQENMKKNVDENVQQSVVVLSPKLEPELNDGESKQISEEVIVLENDTDNTDDSLMVNKTEQTTGIIENEENESLKNEQDLPAVAAVSPENSDSETIKGENDDDNDEPNSCDIVKNDVQENEMHLVDNNNQTEISDQTFAEDEKSLEPPTPSTSISEPLIDDGQPKTELSEQKDLPETSEMSSEIITDLDEIEKYIAHHVDGGQLDLIQTPLEVRNAITNSTFAKVMNRLQCVQDYEDVENQEELEIDAIVNDRPLPSENRSNSSKSIGDGGVNKSDPDANTAETGDGADPEPFDEEQRKHLQELEDMLAASNSNQNPESTTETAPAPEAPSVPDPETRGGLVQNITYFERQEMPNGLTEEEQMLGKVKPFWIPDEYAQNCLHCDIKFTMIKRRHHCRSCGKVLCAQCCNFKAKLPYLEFKEARVCQLCYGILMRIEEIERINGHQLEPTSAISNSHGNNVPDPNNPAEYCSTIPPLEQVSETVQLPPPTVMVPVGVLKRPGSSNLRRSNNSPESSSGERETVKQVMFSDGVRPGGDLVESPPSSSRLPVEEKPVTRAQLQHKSPLAEKILFPFENLSKRIKMSRVMVSDPAGVNLPPIINYYELKTANPSLPSKPNYSQLVECLRDSKLPHVTFGLTKNLHMNAKIVKKSCCNSKECWTFSSKGLASVGQDEVLFVLDCDSLVKSTQKNEKTPPENPVDEPLKFPRDVLRLYTFLYDSASTANLYLDLSHIFFPDGLFGNKENSGFLFTRPTLQCFENINHLPSPPFLVAILIHKWEIPWAKVFPLRLALRLGFEYKVYPSPVISYANRKPVYFEVGHTIMNVLADFRNFHYTLSVVKDLFIIVEEKKRVNLLIPKLSYEKVCKVLSTSNEHVLAFGGNLCLKADSHFACVQNEEYDIQSQYHTQIFSVADSPQKKTGASFIVFSGALKSTTGLKAKMNIVEDGLLVQILPTVMEQFRSAIKDMKDFRIDCGKASETEASEEWVQLKWVNDELTTNLGVRSQIDGLNLEGIQSARIFSNPDYANERYLIRWIEVFLLQINENSRRSEMINANRLAESVAQAFCLALVEYLDQLYENGLTKISLRISLDVDKVGYETGSGEKPLPAQITQPLDCALIPVIMENISTTGIEDPLVIELLFFVLLK